MYKKIIVVLLCLIVISSLNFISAPIPQITIPSYSTQTIISINGSANHNDLQNIQGGSATEKYHLTLSQINLFLNSVLYQFTNNSFNGSGNFQTTGNGTYNNLIVNGNFSAKRPYYTGYDNSTQNFINTANAQYMNLTNNNDYDAYLINITNRQNITFQQTGDYLIVISPEFYQASGTNKLIAFWLRKNGVDVKWSNSRYTMSNGEYNAPSIIYQVDITNPSTDYINIMWYSDSTATQIISIGGLTSPDRPSVPAVLISVQKISEVTE